MSREPTRRPLKNSRVFRLRCALLLLSSLRCSTLESRRLIFDLHPTHQKSDEAHIVRIGTDVSRSTEFKTNLRKLRSSAASYSCKLQNFANIQYHTVIQIGRPCRIGVDTQLFRVVVDTGSSDVWIPSSNCSFCTGVNRFHLNKSCSAKGLDRRIDVKYGDGTKASGSAFVDVITVGELEVAHQFLIAIDSMNSQAAGTMSVDGILGLGHHYTKGVHIDEGRSFVARLFLEHPDLPRMFSFSLSDPELTSKLVFGDPDIHRYAKEPLIYGKSHYMEDTEMWLTSVYSIGFAHTGIERRFETVEHIRGAPSLVDSGTSLLVLEPETWDGLMQELAKSLIRCNISYVEGSLMMCECPDDFRSVSALVINIIDEADVEHPLCMAPDEYIVRSLDPISGRANCVPSLQRGNKRQPVPLIFGMTFLRTFYTNFDIEHNRIGFARSIHSSLPAHARCTVHNKLEKDVWIWSASLVSVGVLFAIYTCSCGDVNACCGWPTCEATKPCGVAYEETPKEERVQIKYLDSEERDVYVDPADSKKLELRDDDAVVQVHGETNSKLTDKLLVA